MCVCALTKCETYNTFTASDQCSSELLVSVYCALCYIDSLCMPVARDCEVGGGNCHLRRAFTSSLSAQSAYDEPSGALPDLLAPWRGGGRRKGERKRGGKEGEKGG